jgi:hypothetical protein
VQAAKSEGGGGKVDVYDLYDDEVERFKECIRRKDFDKANDWLVLIKDETVQAAMLEWTWHEGRASLKQEQNRKRRGEGGASG